MPRLWLALLFSLLALPTPASAEGPGAVPRRRESHIGARTAEYPSDLARSAGGLELLQCLEVRRSKASRTLLDPSVLPGRGGSPGRLRALAAALAEPVVEVCAPHCQRLLYYATAPPARR